MGLNGVYGPTGYLYTVACGPVTNLISSTISKFSSVNQYAVID